MKKVIGLSILFLLPASLGCALPKCGSAQHCYTMIERVSKMSPSERSQFSRRNSQIVFNQTKKLLKLLVGALENELDKTQAGLQNQQLIASEVMLADLIASMEEIFQCSDGTTFTKRKNDAQKNGQDKPVFDVEAFDCDKVISSLLNERDYQIPDHVKSWMKQVKAPLDNQATGAKNLTNQTLATPDASGYFVLNSDQVNGNAVDDFSVESIDAEASVSRDENDVAAEELTKDDLSTDAERTFNALMTEVINTPESIRPVLIAASLRNLKTLFTNSLQKTKAMLQDIAEKSADLQSRTGTSNLDVENLVFGSIKTCILAVKSFANKGMTLVNDLQSDTRKLTLENFKKVLLISRDMQIKLAECR